MLALQKFTTNPNLFLDFRLMPPKAQSAEWPTVNLSFNSDRWKVKITGNNVNENLISWWSIQRMNFFHKKAFLTKSSLTKLTSRKIRLSFQVSSQESISVTIEEHFVSLTGGFIHYSNASRAIVFPSFPGKFLYLHVTLPTVNWNKIQKICCLLLFFFCKLYNIKIFP